MKNCSILLLLILFAIVQGIAQQNVGINTLAPLTTLHVNLGESLSSGILFTGMEPTGGTFPSLGGGRRFMFYPGKAALRAGVVEDFQWDDVNVGSISMAFGFNTIASGSGSFATGDQTKASGGISSVFGSNTIAKGYCSMAVGMYNDSLLSLDQGPPTPITPLFMIGNGDGNATRNNAMVVYKNGNLLLKNPTTVVSVPGMYDIPATGAGTRMMWLPEISSFRVGTVLDTAWDITNIGLGSFASGMNSIASGGISTATGFGTKASGDYSTATGGSTVASGKYSTALGKSSRASGLNSISTGELTIASGLNSTAMGYLNLANSTSSSSSGYRNIAKGFSSTVIGMYNDSILTTNEVSVTSTTPLFIIGNGSGAGAGQRSNAMVVRKDGHVGIGTNAPATFLHVDVGANLSDGFIVQGDGSGSATVPNLGSGVRMTFFPGKGAFRAGGVSTTGWDNSTTGNYSVAMGYNNQASGSTSTALGLGTLASGDYSIATGGASLATGNYSTAMGKSTRASGLNSISLGELTEASGWNSTAMGYLNLAKSTSASALGYRNIAKGFSSTVIGMYNDSILTTNEVAVTSTTPLFIIGNGSGASAGQRSNAMVVRKDGRVGIGSNTPATTLTVIGPAGNPSIPNTVSTGIFRIGLNASEGIDMGKMTEGPFSGWIQAGINGSTADPLSLQPSGGNVGIGTVSPASSAKLEVNSTTKGFLPPRMTLANRNSISTPVAGLMIWCTNCGIHGQLQVYDGTFWANMAGSPGLGTPSIGTLDGGGVIAYILQPGDPGYIVGEIHGLITTQTYQGIDKPYGCSGTNLPGAEGTALGTGHQNTIDIVAGCSTTGIAARICNDLIWGGYNDWHLPSKDELHKLYLNQIAIGGFESIYHWSSSEFGTTEAWGEDFAIGFQFIAIKSNTYYIRAVRTF